MNAALHLHTALRARQFTITVNDGRLIVSPGSNLTEADRETIKANRDELLVIVAGIPAGCLAPMTCAVLGVCGRDQCIADHERQAFAQAVDVARSPTNPHRVPEFDRRDISHEPLQRGAAS